VAELVSATLARAVKIDGRRELSTVTCQRQFEIAETSHRFGTSEREPQNRARKYQSGTQNRD